MELLLFILALITLNVVYELVNTWLETKRHDEELHKRLGLIMNRLELINRRIDDLTKRLNNDK